MTAYTYACGCVAIDLTHWHLCDDCASRIGTYGTCLGCEGPANEQWVTSALPDEVFCSQACAERSAALAAWEES